MERLDENQLNYLREFLFELHRKIHLKSYDDLEDFLSDVLDNRGATYRFSLLDEPGISGIIGVFTNEVGITIGCDTGILGAEQFERELRGIAGDYQVRIYVTERVSNTAPLLGFVGIPLFQENNAKLTIDEFVSRYLDTVRKVQRSVKETGDTYMPSI